MWHRRCQVRLAMKGRVTYRESWRWMTVLMMGGLLGGWHVPAAWSQELTGGMKLLLEELRAVKKSQAEALAQVEDLRRQLQALSAGGLTAVSYRLPAKVEFAGQSVPVGRYDVWERLDQEFLFHISRPGQIMLWLKRMGRYMPLIEQRLKEYGLPDDLKYLAVVESSLRPTAVSSANASGLWQFIEGTGRRYDMESNALVDERMDVSKSTDGAMQYLRRLYDIFHDWPLALAGYNAGEQRVLDELQEQRVSSYYELALPNETERFVYKIVAVKIILSNPERYGLYIDPQEYYRPPEVDIVTVQVSGGRLHLRSVAEAAGTHFAMIKQLNPQFRQRYLPRGTHQVFLPRGTAATFAQNFQESYEPEPLMTSQFSPPVSSKPPAPPPPPPPPRREAPVARKSVHYQVRRGDTLSKIAAKFDASVGELMKWNKLASASHIAPGRQLVILRD
jgi:membrane-bound lytic murein transglycosylase D